MSTTKLDHDAKLDHIDTKGESEHVQNAELRVSEYDSLTRGQAIRKFPRRFIIGLLMSTAAMWVDFVAPLARTDSTTPGTSVTL